LLVPHKRCAFKGKASTETKQANPLSNAKPNAFRMTREYAFFRLTITPKILITISNYYKKSKEKNGKNLGIQDLGISRI